MLIPALNYAERDRLEERLLPDEETAVTETTRELLDAAVRIAVGAGHREAALRVLGYAVNGNPDELALRMLGQLVRDLPITLDITREPQMSSDLVALVRIQTVRRRGARRSAAERADQEPVSGEEASRGVPRLAYHRRTMGERGSGGRDAAPADGSGASHVARTLLETRRYLADAVGVVHDPVSATSTSDAA